MQPASENLPKFFCGKFFHTFMPIITMDKYVCRCVSPAQKNSMDLTVHGISYFFVQDSMPRLVRYFLTISATLKVMASSNSRRSSPVSFLIFSRR